MRISLRPLSLALLIFAAASCSTPSSGGASAPSTGAGGAAAAAGSTGASGAGGDTEASATGMGAGGAGGSTTGGDAGGSGAGGGSTAGGGGGGEDSGAGGSAGAPPMWVPVDGGNGDPRCLTLCTSAMLVSCPLSDYATCVTECEYLCPCAAWDKYYSCAIAAQAWHCNEYGGPSPTGCDSVEQAAGDCVATGDPLHFCPGAAGAGGSG